MRSSEIDPRRLSELYKHMVVAIFDKQSGGEKQRFLAALAIAQSCLQDNKLAVWSSKEPFDFKLTGKGMRKDREHRGDNPRSSARFRALFERYAGVLDVKDAKTTDAGVVGTESLGSARESADT